MVKGDTVRFRRYESCFTCITCREHLLATSFPTVKDSQIPSDNRDRTGECRVCDEIRRGAPVIHAKSVQLRKGVALSKRPPPFRAAFHRKFAE